MSLVDQHRDRMPTASQREWLRVREYLQRHRDELGHAAAEEYAEVPDSPSPPTSSDR